MALQTLRSLQFSSSAATTIANHLDSHNFSNTPTCSCTTHHCSDMNAPRSQIINKNNKKFQFHLNIGGQTQAAPVSTISIGMNGTRYIRPTDLHNTHTLCNCFSDMDDTRKKLDVRINSVGEVHSIESKTLGEDDSCGAACSSTQFSALSCGQTCASPTKTDFNFNNMTLDGANFSGADLSGATFDNTTLQDCDFSGANLTGSVIKLDVLPSGNNFHGVNFSGSKLNFGRNDYVAIFDQANFTGVEFTKSIYGGSFKNADFSGVQGMVISPMGHDMDFTGANLSNITFRFDSDSWGPGIVADNTNFRYIVMSGGGLPYHGIHSMKNADFTGAKITNFYFLNSFSSASCDLSGADFTGATLKTVGFTYVNLTNVKFKNAKVDDCVFTGANLTGADLSGVTWSNTTCPDGTNSDNNSNTCIGHLQIPHALCNTFTAGYSCTGGDYIELPSGDASACLTACAAYAARGDDGCCWHHPEKTKCEWMPGGTTHKYGGNHERESAHCSLHT